MSSKLLLERIANKLLFVFIEEKLFEIDVKIEFNFESFSLCNETMKFIKSFLKFSDSNSRFFKSVCSNLFNLSEFFSMNKLK